jgi:hypothetical protein
VVGLRTLAMTQVLAQREEAGAVAQRRKPGEGLAPLVGRQPPGPIRWVSPSLAPKRCNCVATRDGDAISN